MSRAPLVLVLLVLAILGTGISITLMKNVEVAGLAHGADEGRLHYHTKNVTRLGGTPEHVHRHVQRAVTLRDAPPGTAPTGDWRDVVRQAIDVRPPVRHAVVLPAEGPDALAWALPGAYWAAYAGVPVLFATGDGLDAQSAATLSQGTVPLYVLAPASLISDDVVERLAAGRRVTRVAGDALDRHAVAIAEYRDPSTGFGWGRTHDARNGYFHFVVAAPSDAEAALAALPLAPSNAATFLFAADDGSLPAATDRYVWAQRADWFVTPAEGPFRHFWIAGDRMSYRAQGRLDLAPEKAPYVSMGPAALGPLEGLGIVFIALGVAGALFVAVHGARLLPEVMLPTRLAWTMTALLLPVAGVVLYLAAYRRPRIDAGGHMPKWLRPPAVQAAAATAMGFGYGAPLMIAIGYAFVWFGFPLFFGDWADDWTFLFGAGMPIMMIGMYVGAVLLAWPLVQTGMQAMMHGASRRTVLWRALGVTALSMAAVSIGMMTTSWWMLMNHLPMMPHEDEILWFGSMWLASAVGFLIAWPLNWPMVRTHLKPGTS